ncbi:carbohydrate ABC transporter permease [Conexibacter woesei]|uniref:Binding-protein-dependent transport systems inner membrane component n=1 Tax=Conexibacter woesei (strain DSM 14684 / CCUG 47730 / CIP 108061 / JCM 11494 / NBRC 100937 / ID131577) TaxID=469383 RepID=D3F3K8_CONWI|nr:sugar ABC transporter permease [Conexibacter woesei]ADB52373.1 binding-protein-dependent transport systems inner membrane component [Conexibacter woesei DSM 14684]
MATVAAPPARRAASRRPLRRRLLGEHPGAWGFILPSVVLVLGLNLIPIAWAFVLSLKSSDLLTPGEWVGLDNYDRLLQDGAFRAAVEHTAIYTGLFVPLSVAGGLAIALMLNRRIRFVGLYRTCVFVPFIISAAAQGVLFAFVFDPQFGVANAALDKVGVAQQGFLQDPGQALYVLIGIGLWGGVGFCVIVFLAALQDIPRELTEAASIDGAGRWSTFRNVVLPSLRNVTIFLLTWQTFQALQLFDLAYATTRGGPLDATVVVVYFVYQQAFQFFEAGYGAAAAYVLGAAILGVGVLGLGLRRLAGRTA